MQSTGQPLRLWVSEEAAEYLGVPLKTLYRWRSENKGPVALKIGKYLRWDPEAVVAWAHAQADQSQDGAA